MPSIRFMDSVAPTYNFTAFGVNPPAGTGVDVWQLQGVNLKTIKIRYVRVGGVAVAARSQSINLIRRAGSDTGGAPTNPVPRPADTSDAPSGVVVSQFTTSPTPGPTPSVLETTSFVLVTSGSLQDRATFDYSQLVSKAPVLNNANDFYCVGFGGVALVATDKLECSIWWTEQ